ncbi:MAG: Asp-tRNA(Asn)/Glu-tRNA(Gln) amidotransferase subunit GatA [Clostridiales bacterium]|jgi:aspartyl-tRNA(Asn)/glutamyl-tRNA(Gln) amidotransferase subunit A|nr:Asp-tRNA(Asn)/Glu-tRNA(Gln) amidotransferase subunit GatA [Clostridiales bacterium]
MSKILSLDAFELGAEIKKRNVSVKEATQAVLSAIEQKDKDINSFITICKQSALLQAEEIQKKIDGSEIDSPLAGVPTAIKDNICVDGERTTCASKMLENFISVYDASAVTALKSAGCPIVGKLNMDEFAMGSTSETSFFGAVKNPHDLTKVSGGSSGGAAAAVAAEIVPFTLGSDTGGSVRQPASFCGVTGFKPTYGKVSRWGLIAYASSLDQIGPVAKTAYDCALITDQISGLDKKDSTSFATEKVTPCLTSNVKGMKIALPEQCFNNKSLNSEVKAAVIKTAETLEAAGAEIEWIKLPFIDYVIPAYYILAAAEASSNLSRFDGVKYGFHPDDCKDISDLYLKARTQGFGAEVKKRIILGAFVLSSGYYDAYYLKALKAKTLIKNKFDEIFTSFDAVLCPTAPSSAPKLGDSLSDALAMYLSDVFTVPVNLAALPAVSVPCGFDSENMPIGAQIIGAAKNDGTVLNIAHTFQQLTDFHKRRGRV